LSGRGLCDELITRPEESYRPCCVVVCDLETSRMGAPYIYDISRLRVKGMDHQGFDSTLEQKIFHFSRASETALGPTILPIQLVPEAYSSGL